MSSVLHQRLFNPAPAGMLGIPALPLRLRLPWRDSATQQLDAIEAAQRGLAAVRRPAQALRWLAMSALLLGMLVVALWPGERVARSAAAPKLAASAAPPSALAASPTTAVPGSAAVTAPVSAAALLPAPAQGTAPIQPVYPEPLLARAAVAGSLSVREPTSAAAKAAAPAGLQVTAARASPATPGTTEVVVADPRRKPATRLAPQRAVADQDALRASEREQAARARQLAEQQQQQEAAARARAAEAASPLVMVAAAAPAPQARAAAGVRDGCAASGGFIAQQLCHARECRKSQHEGDAVCARLRDIEQTRARVEQ
jgi:hypothetical protein